jgi:hypothetical protein
LITNNNGLDHALLDYGIVKAAPIPQLCAVQLVDSHYCSDASKFISVLVTSLSTMLQLALPHINVLSKIDLVESYGELGILQRPSCGRQSFTRI